MKYDLVSDLHVEFSEIPDFASLKNEGSDVLVIAGDTSNEPSMTLHVVKEAAKVYGHVIFTDGNHEHYDSHNTVTELMQWFLKEGCGKNITYLNGKTFKIIGDTAFVGACGWYDFNTKSVPYDIAKKAWEDYSNDTFCNFGEYEMPDVLADWQANNLTDIIYALNGVEGVNSIVVTTHTAPREDLLRETHDIQWNQMNGSYCNSLMNNVLTVGQKIKAWNYGHTHERKQVMSDGILYTNNAKGYGREGNNWFMVQIDTDCL